MSEIKFDDYETVAEFLEACSSARDYLNKETVIKHVDEPSFRDDVIKAMKDAGMGTQKNQVDAMIKNIVKVTSLLMCGSFPVELTEKITRYEVEKINAKIRRAQERAEGLYDSIESKCREVEHVKNHFDSLVSETQEILTRENIEVAEIQDERAVTMIKLFNAISRQGKEMGADSNVAVRCASYATWAYATNAMGTFGTLEIKDDVSNREIDFQSKNRNNFNKNDNGRIRI